MKHKDAIDSCERSIILAADSIAKLRLPDVMRVMQDFYYAHGSTGEILDYIISNRPDLTVEANSCHAELAQAPAGINSPDDCQKTAHFAQPKVEVGDEMRHILTGNRFTVLEVGHDADGRWIHAVNKLGEGETMVYGESYLNNCQKIPTSERIA